MLVETGYKSLVLAPFITQPVPKNPKILGSRAKTHAGGCCVGGLKGLEDDAKFEACVVRLP
jgi:hypothetical protein